MYTRYNMQVQGLIRPIDHPALPQPSQDSHWHQHYRHYLSKQRNLAAKERIRAQLMERARVLDEYYQPQKSVEEDISETRSVTSTNIELQVNDMLIVVASASHQCNSV